MQVGELFYGLWAAGNAGRGIVMAAQIFNITTIHIYHISHTTATLVHNTGSCSSAGAERWSRCSPTFFFSSVLAHLQILTINPGASHASQTLHDKMGRPCWMRLENNLINTWDDLSQNPNARQAILSIAKRAHRYDPRVANDEEFSARVQKARTFRPGVDGSADVFSPICEMSVGSQRERICSPKSCMHNHNLQEEVLFSPFLNTSRTTTDSHDMFFTNSPR